MSANRRFRVIDEYQVCFGKFVVRKRRRRDYETRALAAGAALDTLPEVLTLIPAVFIASAVAITARRSSVLSSSLDPSNISIMRRVDARGKALPDRQARRHRAR